MSIKTYYQNLKPSYNIPWDRQGHLLDRKIDACPYCTNRHITKRGKRRTKHEIVQLYQCKACSKTFTPKVTLGKRYPLKVIFDGISYYNLGHSKADTGRLLKERYGQTIKPDTLSAWLKEHSPLCRYERFREKIKRSCPPPKLIKTAILNHQQVYHFRYHAPKLKELLKASAFRHPRFAGIEHYLESVITGYPHKLFQGEHRSSKAKLDIDFDDTRTEIKKNHANRLAQLIMQAVTDNRQRHEALQQFMLVNDSVTVAMEVPVYLTPSDLEYFKQKLNLKVPLNFRKTLTGHIDILQVRNGHIHILDFKPRARKEKPYAQLIIYALALSRHTGLMLKDIKCAWFDENDYFEFFPLAMIHKI